MLKLWQKEIVKRLIFGIIMMMLFLAAVLWRFPDFLTAALFASSIFLSLEYHNLLSKSKKNIHLSLLIVPNLLMLSAARFMPNLNWFLLILGLILLMSGVFLYMLRRKINFVNLYLLNYAWLGLAGASFLGLRFFDNPQKLMIFLTLVIVTCDITAYFGGKSFGKRKLAPNISPKKTVEGLAIGVLCSSLVGLIIGYVWDLFLLIESLSLGFLLALISQIGDLIESKFKRLNGVKNSSNFIPGHGGFLDRFDGLLLGAILFFCYLLVKNLILNAA